MNLSSLSLVVTLGLLGPSVSKQQVALRSVEDNAHFRGALIRRGESQVQILDLVWGVNQRDGLSAVYSRLQYPDGSVVVTDRRGKAKRVFASANEMHGFFMDVGQSPEGEHARLWIEDIDFAVDHKGRIVISRWKARTEDGAVENWRRARC